MLQRERFDDPEEALRIALDGYAVALWTALPGIVQSYDPIRGTCSVVPSINGMTRNPNGTTSFVNLPSLGDVPVVYMGGGSFVATFPIQQGDEALVIFSSRCIDSWFQNGGVQNPARRRIHSMSDGFAIIGPRSLARSIPNVSTSTVQLRSLDGSTYYELAGGQVANIVAPGGINITGDVNVTGKVTATGEGQFNNIPVSTHKHTGVQPGSGTSGEPIA
jgi:Phage protein Gp138 N-terminal domain/GpV Apex motif